MKKVLLTLAALAAALSLTATAEAGRWIPGTPTYAEESDVADLLEQAVDHAYCTGIPRFGHRGEFPYEEFVVFDCSWSHNDTYCSDVRYKAIKARPRGYYKLKELRPGDCF